MAYDTNMLLCHLCIFFGEISVKIFACFLNCVVFFFTFTDVFLSALGSCCCAWLSLVELSLGHLLVVVRRLLAVASLVVENRL